MNFEREVWRPLFLREPVSQRAWNLVARGLRVYLIRLAEDDGTLLKRCSDPFELAASLSAHPEEVELVRGAIDTLLHDGFLRWQGDADSPGWLGVDRLVTFVGGDHGAPVGESEPTNDVQETAADRRRRKARERKRRSRGVPRCEERDATDVTSVTDQRDIEPSDGVTEERDSRDQRDLPPHTPPSDRDETTGNERDSGAPARDGKRDRPGDTGSVTSVTSERDRFGSAGVTRTFTMPEGGPTKEYFDECTLAGVKREQAVSTWNHYYGAGLPVHGVERLTYWLAQRAKEKSVASARVDRGSLLGRAVDDPGTQGHLRIEPQQDHRRLADKHGLKLEEFVDRVRKDPRYKNLGTVDVWRVLTRMLESAAKQKRGAA